MSNYNLLISQEEYEQILRVAASQPDVKKALLNSHDNSTWWPVHISDWRTRMLIAGLSARISYRMVHIYREIVEDLNSYTWDDITNMSEAQFKQIIRKIGLYNNRVNFWKSLVIFISYLEDNHLDFFSFSNDYLIRLIQENVNGASYKLAQCCVLYAKGYYSGIMPVDSGMKDLLGPCLGFPIPPGSYGHEAFRKKLEHLTSSVDCRKIAYELGYHKLNIPDKGPLTWWAHIVLISYKRYYCNNRNPENCPFKRDQVIKKFIGSTCSKDNPIYGGVRVVIIEGLDKSGKTSLSRLISKQGFKKSHFGYNKENNRSDIIELYEKLFEKTKKNRLIMDRSFISEYVYGPILRSESRLCDDDFTFFMKILIELKALVIYLYAPKEILLERLKGTRHKKSDEFLSKSFQDLSDRYSQIMDRVSLFLPVKRFDTSKTDLPEILTSLII
jgi:thymidylate kinase/endonuclease III